jgi:hypothetical protein
VICGAVLLIRILGKYAVEILNVENKRKKEIFDVRNNERLRKFIRNLEH